jgi:atrial natriuretic peptide receptor A
MWETTGAARDAYSRVAFSRASTTIKVRITDDDGNPITEGPDSTQVIALQPISILEDIDTTREHNLAGRTWSDIFPYPDAKAVRDSFLPGTNSIQTKGSPFSHMTTFRYGDHFIGAHAYNAEASNAFFGGGGAWKNWTNPELFNQPRPVVGTAEMHYVSRADYLNDFQTAIEYPWVAPGDVRDLWGGESPPNLWVQAIAGVATFDTEMIFMQPTVAIENSTGYPYVTGDPYVACCPMSMVASTELGVNVASEAFHVFHDAQKLELVGSLPSTAKEGVPLNDIEVQIMTSTELMMDQGLDAPLFFPLTHGPDVDIYIELTVSWDKKIFADASPSGNVSKYAMDLSPLFASQVLLGGDDVTTNYQDDLVIRKRSTKLPSGAYGAIFEGVTLHNVDSAVRLNFTMIYPGGNFAEYEKVNAIPPPAFSRVGLGHTEFTRIWEDKGVVDFFEYGVTASEDPAYLQLYQNPLKANEPDGDKLCVDKCDCPGPSNSFETLTQTVNPLLQWVDMCVLTETLLELATQLYSTGTSYQGEYGGDGPTAIKSLQSAPQRLYQDWGDAATSVAPDACSTISDVRRRTWCETTGFTMDLSKNQGPGVLITDPIDITARTADALAATWDRNTDLLEVHAFRSLKPVVLKVLDASAKQITTGIDSSYNVTATATVDLTPLNSTDDLTVLQLCVNAQASCGGTACKLADTLKMIDGELNFYPGICDVYHPNVDHIITFTITTAAQTLTAVTDAFRVTDEIPVAVLVPTLDTNAIGPSVRAIKHMAEVGFRGFDFDTTHVDYRLEIGAGIFGEGSARLINQVPHYIYVSGTASEQIDQIRSATEHHGFRQFLGPFDIEVAGPICTWISTEMPHITAYLPTLSGDGLHGKMDNCVKMVPSVDVQTEAFVNSIAARGWTSIAVVQDRSQRGLTKEFYDAISVKGITLLVDVDVSPEINKTMAEHMERIKESGARVVYSAMVGPQSSDVYNAAIDANLVSTDGVQWIGDDDAFKNFQWEEITAADTNFEGASFLSLAHGLASKNTWFKMCYGIYGSPGTSNELISSKGGVDPIRSSLRGYDFFDLDVWGRSDFLYVADAISLMSQLSVNVIKLGFAVSGENFAAMNDAQLSGVIGAEWLWNGFFTFDKYRSSTKMTAAWAQLKPNLVVQSAAHTNTNTVLDFTPWVATEGIKYDNGVSTEGQILDMETTLKLPKPTWGPKIDLTRRKYTGYPDGLGMGALVEMEDMVPVTFACTKGCGRGHTITNQSSSDYSFYNYINGECVGPDTCVCDLRTVAQTPAYDGVDCETPVCDLVCVHGGCVDETICVDRMVPATNDTNSSIATDCSLDTHCHCEDGWTGPACDIAVCDTYGCSTDHGDCMLPDTCACESNFYSQSCEAECACVSGTCNDGAAGTGECTCEVGFFGAKCADACNCLQEQGVCNDGASGDGSCRSCAPGFLGGNCDQNCTCAHGECQDGIAGDGLCRSCEIDWIGSECNTECTCQHGICADGVDGTGICKSCDSGWLGDDCDMPLAMVAVPAAVGAILVIALIVLIAKIFIKRAKDAAMLANTDWKIDYSEISRQKDKATQESLMFQSMKFQSNAGGFGAASTTSLGPQTAQALNKSVGKYHDSVVFVKKISKASIALTPQLRQEVKAVREANHPNVLGFVGASIDAPNVCILTTFAQKGSLDDILASEDVRLSWDFKDSIIKDIARGMQFISKSQIKSHGRLKSSNCVIDNRWTVKITDYGLPSIRLGQEKDVENYNADAQSGAMLWTAPELLKVGAKTLDDVGAGSQEGDVYSFGILMNEVMTRETPYSETGLSAEEILPLIANSKAAPGGGKAWSLPNSVESFVADSSKLLRPEPPTDKETEKEAKNYIALSRQCWNDDPTKRPTMNEVVQQLAKISPQKGEMVDNLIKMLEKYSTGLEAIVAQRTAELESEKQKVEDLVCKMLPKRIIEDLKVGKDVKAESFENVTIFFSDIVGFTAICSKSEPLQVVDLLNDLYTTFDTIVDEYDVYKVETIGDAYMVVSGLPERNGDRHAGEIASMAIHLLSAMADFKIRHMPEVTLQLRVGLHSGPCVAGVVGVKMPRYCLFGDTVNIASRMESGGLALRCHVSETTALLLTKLGGYNLNCRGIREVKGRGQMKTYWLDSKDGFAHSIPDVGLAVSESQTECK